MWGGKKTLSTEVSKRGDLAKLKCFVQRPSVWQLINEFVLVVLARVCQGYSEKLVPALHTPPCSPTSPGMWRQRVGGLECTPAYSVPSPETKALCLHPGLWIIIIIQIIQCIQLRGQPKRSIIQELLEPPYVTIIICPLLLCSPLF